MGSSEQPEFVDKVTLTKYLVKFIQRLYVDGLIHHLNSCISPTVVTAVSAFTQLCSVHQDGDKIEKREANCLVELNDINRDQLREYLGALEWLFKKDKVNKIEGEVSTLVASLMAP
mmetsp:Transcript_38937/g.59183  ORF Transcript_38937/g.59183 Transcript_38937/m.59183 type:complete len:116 (-) Transcript_38937:55-402(-)